MSTNINRPEVNKSITSGKANSPVSPEPSPIPTREHALDGSQYHNIIEEQAYSELPPTPEEQKPWRVFHQRENQRESQSESQHDTKPADRDSHEAPTISVGSS